VKQVTATGQTVDDAVNSALEQLKVTKDRAEIHIIDEGKKGLFGIFGARPAVVKVKLLIDPIEEAEKFLREVTEKMGAPAKIETVKNGKNIEFKLSGDNMALLIGKRGQTLNSLQYLTQLVANRYSNEYFNITVDAENYRERRKETLIQLAERLAEKAVKTKQDIALEPMPSFERKIIHTALASNEKVKTYSNGTEPNRHLVISPMK
jgi:spoIIIJ-associated protein